VCNIAENRRKAIGDVARRGQLAVIKSTKNQRRTPWASRQSATAAHFDICACV
jgi:hypothetical protein